ncbi:MAG: exodeoxyribonuclease VII large subunit [Candidatus Omnitrophica bacterium]|nr:exodeoxyribonuclease VII large subunit [Candidatus Omnitrophota bacterium]MDD5672013.1 exodeoxyribonuclease VII large subunit [Candidatus Omnitrophota bacterium]
MEPNEVCPVAPEGTKAKVYTVSELNRTVRSLLESEYPTIWVEGEISNFKHHSSGHCYLTLKDENSQISAVFFSRYNMGLKFEPKDGLKVLAFGKISLYETRGQYQLYIERLEPRGLGALQLAFLQLKEKLEKEGLFRTDRKRPIPKFPQVVGVVTSPTGAAIRDILNVVGRRFHGTQILIYPVRVQGEGSAGEIAAAIREMNQIEGLDVLIVGRGGGSLEDLWAFNEEIVARAVYDSRIPVISAVGHEIDWTICDFVADLRAPTPSAAAELVVQNRAELENRLLDYQLRMRNAVLGFVEGQRQTLERLEASYAFKQPQLLMDQFSQRVDDLLRQLQNYTKSMVNQKKQEFQTAVGRLNALSPLAILERGYSLTFNPAGQLLREIRDVKTGDELKTRLRRGMIYSNVTRIEKQEGGK